MQHHHSPKLGRQRTVHHSPKHLINHPLKEGFSVKSLT
jgi:hypothetical protein